MEKKKKKKKERKMNLLFQIYADDYSRGKMTRNFFIEKVFTEFSLWKYLAC